MMGIPLYNNSYSLIRSVFLYSNCNTQKVKYKIVAQRLCPEFSMFIACTVNGFCYNTVTTSLTASSVRYRASPEALVFFRPSKMQKTFVYVDGFNLYYGSLRKTKYKWLDLKALCKKLLGENHEIVAIKYYTATISSRGSEEDSVRRQQVYLRAIQSYIPELSIYYGHYLTSKIRARLCNPEPNNSAYVNVYKTEEKGSDVNLALHLLNDAWHNLYDCAVLISNDSDLAEALRLVKGQHQKNVGLIVPGDEKKRHPSRELAKYANFIKRIRNHVLESSQLPGQIPNMPLKKPEIW